SRRPAREWQTRRGLPEQRRGLGSAEPGLGGSPPVLGRAGSALVRGGSPDNRRLLPGGTRGDRRTRPRPVRPPLTCSPHARRPSRSRHGGGERGLVLVRCPAASAIGLPLCWTGAVEAPPCAGGVMPITSPQGALAGDGARDDRVRPHCGRARE